MSRSFGVKGYFITVQRQGSRRENFRMKITGKKPWYLEYLLIIIGTGLMATAITSCFDAAGMVTGGFSGIAIIVKAGTKGLYGNGVPLWVTNLVLNVPVFFLAAKIKGFSFVKRH